MKNNQSSKVLFIAQAAMIAAIYVVLTLLGASFSYGEVQVRISEALTILPVFTPAAIPGVFLGCLISNILGGCILPDIIFGSLATLIGAVFTWLLRSRRPVIGTLPPIIANVVIVPLVLRIAIPSMLAQFVSVLYSIVDRIYISNIPVIGETALAGVGVCGPVVTLIGAFASLIGVGGAPLMSIRMGAGKTEEARRILSNSFLMLCVCSVALMAVVFPLRQPMLMAFGASDATYGYANTYFSVYLTGTVFNLLALGLNQFIICQGYAKKGMISVMLGAALNIVLDPVFIFGFNMGVKGAALATITSQGVSAVWVVWFLLGKRTRLRLQRQYLRPSWRVLAPVLALGVSPFIMQSTESLVNIAFNSSLKAYGGNPAVGAMTICSSVLQIFFLLLQGIAQGAQPIIGFNYGAGKLDRVKKAFKLLLISAFTSSCTACLALELFPHAFVMLFNDKPELVDLAVWALRIYVCGMFMLGIQTSCQQTFVALGQAKISLFLALLRKVILLLPLILILPRLITGHQVMAVFLAEPVADILAALTTGSLFFWRFPKLLRAREAELKEQSA